MSKRAAITVGYKQLNADSLRVAEEPYSLEKGGKLVSIRYDERGRVYDILRIQTPELNIGQVWENMDQTTQQLASYTISLNLDRLHPEDVGDSVTSASYDGVKREQFEFYEKLDMIDEATVSQATARGWFKEKGKPLEREKVEGKFSPTVHWPSDSKYTLSIRVKINTRDTDFAVRKIGIYDQNNNDISYYKVDPVSNKPVYFYETRFGEIDSLPVFNIDVLKTRKTRVIRSIIESNNAWIQTGLSCSWKLYRIQVETDDLNESAPMWVTEGAGAGAAAADTEGASAAMEADDN